MKNVKVCLLHPPQHNVLDDKQYPPTGLMYISSYLKSKGVDTKLVDLASLKEGEWKKKIIKADLYGITCYTPSFTNVRKIAKACKEINPEAKIAVGGPHPTVLPEDTLKYGEFDSIVIGEGEEAMHKMAKELGERGRIERMYTAPLIKNLDELPFPDREDLNHEKYSMLINGRHVTSIITARGCPYNCSFCYKGLFGSKMRFRSVENVVAEVKECISKYNIKAFIFFDDIFAIHRKRLYEMLKEFEKLDITFRCNGRAGINNYEDFIKLKKAGCETVAFGIESFSQGILDKCRKQVSVRQNIDVIKEANKAGLKSRAYMIFGLPGETEETVEETMKGIEESQPDNCGLTTFVPLPGSDVWNNPESYGVTIKSRNYDEYYTIGSDGTGGQVVRLDTLSDDEFSRLNKKLREFVNRYNRKKGSNDE